MPAPDLASLCDDLEAEHADLDTAVAPAEAAAWDLATPAPGWTVRDQIHHLGWFDRNAVLALEDADGFASTMNEMVADFGAFESKMRGSTCGASSVRLLDRAFTTAS